MADSFQDLMAAYNISDIPTVLKTSDNNNIENFNLKPDVHHVHSPSQNTDELDGNKFNRPSPVAEHVELNIPSVYSQSDHPNQPADALPSNSLQKLEQLVRAEPQKPKRRRLRAVKPNLLSNHSPILKVPQFTGRQSNQHHSICNRQRTPPFGVIPSPESHHMQSFPQSHVPMPAQMNIPRNPFPPHFVNQFYPPMRDALRDAHPPNDCFPSYQMAINRNCGLPMTMMPPPPHIPPQFPPHGLQYPSFFNHQNSNSPGMIHPGGNINTICMNNGSMFRGQNSDIIAMSNGLVPGIVGSCQIDGFDNGRNVSPRQHNQRSPSDRRLSASSSTPEITAAVRPVNDPAANSSHELIADGKSPKTGQDPPIASPQNSSSVKKVKRKKPENSPVSEGIPDVAIIEKENPLPKYVPMIADCDKHRAPSAVYSCQSCKDTFLFESSLEDHINRSSVEISYHCEYCAKNLTFYNKCAHIKHVQKHSVHGVTPKFNPMVKVLLLAPEEKQLLESAKTGDSHPLSTGNEVQCLPDDIICPECSKKFKSYEELEKHFQGTGRLNLEDVCTQCQLPLPSYCSLKAHKRIHQRTLPQVCPECGLNIISKEGFSDHIKMKCLHLSRTIRYMCNVCDSLFEDQPTANKHMRSKHADGYFKCHCCPMAFKSRESFYGHFSSTHGNLNPEEGHTWIVKCPMCNTVFRKGNVLNGHIQKHYAEEMKYRKFRFQCFLCRELLRKKTDLIYHLEREHEYRYTRCDKCNFTCKDHTEFLVHVKSCTGFVESNMKAKKSLSLPEKSNTQSKSTVNSKTTTTLQQPANNSKQGSSSESLKTLYAPYECPICFNKYFYKDSLYKHRRIHEKQGQFICLLCSQVFPDKTSQTEHSRSCWKTKSHQQMKDIDIHFCKICNNTFVTKADVKKHVETVHTTRNTTAPLLKSSATDPNVPVFEILKSENDTKRQSVENELNEMFDDIETEVSPVIKKHTCSTCAMVFDTKEQMESHAEKSHTSSLFKYICYICRDCQVYKAFHRRDYLEKHIVNFHKITRAKIDYTRFPDEPSKPVTTKISHVGPESSNKRKIEPSQPELSVKRRKSVEIASAEDSEADEGPSSDDDDEDDDDDDELLKCSSCSYSSKNRGAYEDHIAEHRAEKESIECPECGISFVVERTLRNHLLIVHKVRNYEKYLRRQRAKKHFDDHIVLPSAQVERMRNGTFDSDSSCEMKHELECRRCKKEFDTEIGLKKHIERAHPNWRVPSTKKRIR